MTKIEDEEYWFEGLPSIGINALKTGEEEYWFQGLPAIYISEVASNGGDFFEFMWGIG